MTYTQWCASPLGNILLAAEGVRLTGLWFEDEKYFAHSLKKMYEERNTPVLQRTKQWLNMYFSGKEPKFTVPFYYNGTDFQNEVWDILCTIPYGHTASYGSIAQLIAEKRGLARMSARAIGNAVAHNEISIIIPCHRVIGSNGNITGYAGGLHRKIHLLTLEGIRADAKYALSHPVDEFEHRTNCNSIMLEPRNVYKY